MKVLKRVKKIARNVRKWTEEAHENGMITGGDDELGGYCAIASYELLKRLKRAKINASIAGNENHAFVLIDDYKIDVTATQFAEYRDIKVFIEKIEDETFSWEHEIEWKVKTRKELLKELKAWPREQQHPDIQEAYYENN